MGASRVEIHVYDVKGRLVQTLESGVRNPGYHTATWDLRDSNGAVVGSGIYLFRLSVGQERATLKQLILNP